LAKPVTINFAYTRAMPFSFLLTIGRVGMVCTMSPYKVRHDHHIGRDEKTLPTLPTENAHHHRGHLQLTAKLPLSEL
jgi:hypothetical protein